VSYVGDIVDGGAAGVPEDSARVTRDECFDGSGERVGYAEECGGSCGCGGVPFWMIVF